MIEWCPSRMMKDAYDIGEGEVIEEQEEKKEKKKKRKKKKTKKF